MHVCANALRYEPQHLQAHHGQMHHQGTSVYPCPTPRAHTTTELKRAHSDTLHLNTSKEIIYINPRCHLVSRNITKHEIHAFPDGSSSVGSGSVWECRPLCCLCPSRNSAAAIVHRPKCRVRRWPAVDIRACPSIDYAIFPGDKFPNNEFALDLESLVEAVLALGVTSTFGCP